MTVKRGQKPLPPELKRVSHHFKLKPTVKHLIEENSARLGMSKTGYVEHLVENDNNKPMTDKP